MPRFLLCCASFLACASAASLHAASPDDFAMSEAILRHELYRLPHAPRHYFVRVAGVDITVESVARLRDLPVTVQPGSELKAFADQPVGPDVSFNVDAPPVIVGDGVYETAYHYACGSLCGGTSRVALRYDEGHWTVITAEMLIIY